MEEISKEETQKKAVRKYKDKQKQKISIEKESEAKFEDLYAEYSVDPIKWVKDKFGVNILNKAISRGCEVETDTGLTLDQEAALIELSKLISSRLKAHYNLELTKEEEEYNKKIGISIQAGKGLGKDFLAALIGLYILDVFPKSRVPCMANTEKQLVNVLWSQFSELINMAVKISDTETILSHRFEMQSHKIFEKTYKGKEWFAEQITINVKGTDEEQKASISGRHADFKVYILDEASGMPNSVLDTLESALTGIVNFIILIFNPTRTTGFAVKSHKEDSDRWVCLRWNGEKSEFKSVKQNANRIADKYGKESTPYRVGVLGLPPLKNQDSFINYEWIERAVDRVMDTDNANAKTIMGLDFGAGEDPTIACIRNGGLTKFLEINDSDDGKVIGKVISWFYEYNCDILFGDSLGIGWSAMGSLRRELGNYRVKNVDSRGKPSSIYDRENGREKYLNKRAELYDRLRDLFRFDLISIPDDQELIDQLSVIKTSNNTKGLLQIERKEKLSKEIGSSTNKSDALAYTCEEQDWLVKKEIPTGDDDFDEELDFIALQNRMGNRMDERAWMGC
ncbi:MAG: hypothetical protein IT451_11885 [Candidatus Brocadia sp.]|nr:hypothetical protein [Candidatus Brocadia sp.]